MITTNLPRALYSTLEVAEMTGYSRQTIGTWCRNGVIPAIRFGGVGDWRIAAKVVEELRNGAM